jgi:hypothetical protein
MPITTVLLDTSQTVGNKLDPEMQAEIEAVAPSALDPGEIQEVHFDDDVVSRRAIAPGAVGTVEIDTDGVDSPNIKAGAVGTSELAADSVTRDKAGAGVMTAADTAGNPITVEFVPITSVDYAALDPKLPNVLYATYSPI